MTKYLVTGGCGFVGSHLCDALVGAGAGVIVLDNLSTGKTSNLPVGAQLVEGDVADPDAVARAIHGVDGVFHLAGIASVEYCNTHWREGHRTNLTGSVTVFEAAKNAGKVPVVYTSSAAVYGDAGDGAAHEDRMAAPLTAYGADKLGSELHARIATSVHGVPTIGLRPFNIYGPRQDPSSAYSGVISIFNDRLRTRQPITIFGDGLQTRDFVVVTDVVQMLIAAMRKSPAEAGRVFNACTGRATSLLDLMAILARLHRTEPNVTYCPPRAGDIRHSLGDPARATAALGVQASVALEAGLKLLLGI
ncbi:MAG: NAD-dependent epimerase/dehydratase family protein [Tabrizicola sp.]|uniref:NAD-dependent epimerase/dehydratase family protein n=1 Tax=Tabrizicola sp. TaxID=2005166 RepID=UPI002734FF3B|nr:NAD-dependent epimerase/dehydratase family protein [Tabrizicola sp.]MDP3262532.1 NAD-dependent epimerase/dehydratase family protein [Tabrizicola sp.]MDP3648448.1 NAD-dependent epimerase/dehydratase family protein [Paracoccaceae bacterium]MDZ4067750.1 NAD-dependent epimerase/dehydratase family protein [Tabrizicola sp.]